VMTLLKPKPGLIKRETGDDYAALQTQKKEGRGNFPFPEWREKSSSKIYQVAYRGCVEQMGSEMDHQEKKQINLGSGRYAKSSREKT